MKRILFTSIAAIIGLTITAQDVAQWREPNRNGIYNETGLMKKWPDAGPAIGDHLFSKRSGLPKPIVSRGFICVAASPTIT